MVLSLRLTISCIPRNPTLVVSRVQVSAAVEGTVATTSRAARRAVLEVPEGWVVFALPSSELPALSGRKTRRPLTAPEMQASLKATYVARYETALTEVRMVCSEWLMLTLGAEEDEHQR